MTESREHFALDWIRREIDETLKAARSALEAYAESDHDETKMRACLTYLHQVHGTLLMLELTGVTLLSDEMEQLAQAMLTGGVRDVDGAKQLLMQAILQLPAFLEEIQKGRTDSRRAVLPLANELRGARGERLFDDPRRPTGPLHEAPTPDTLRRFDEIDGVEKARRIRAAYQQVLLSVLKGENRQAALTTLAKVAVGLQRICERTPSAALWRTFAAYVAALADSGTELSGDVVRLLRRVDAEIKTLSQGGAEALNRPLPVDLVKQLVEAARGHGAISSDIEELAGAVDLTSDEDHVAVSKREAIQTAAAALREELASVKDALDLFVRSDNRTADGLLQLAAPLKQIGSTLSILGFESSRAIVADQLEAIQQAAGGDHFDDSLLLGVAAALLQVDENLAGIARHRADTADVSEASAIIGHAQIAVLEEARSGLEQVKQAVVDYVSAQWDVNRLAEVPTLLAAVKGALAMVPLTRPAEQLNRCLVYVNNELLAGNAPDWTALDAFADAISGIDYHLERLCENTTLPGDEILDLVERSLSELGYGIDSELARRPLRPVEAVTAPVIEATLPAEEPTPTQAQSPPPQQVVPEPPGAEATVEEPPPDAPSRSDSFERQVEDLDEPNSEPVSVDEVAEEVFDLESSLFDASGGGEAAEDAAVADESIPARAADGDATRVEPVDEAEAEAEPAQRAPAQAVKSPRKSVVDTTADIDDDILEIFIEEVGEVLDNIDHWLPQWESDYGNEEALTEVRRAFHTLKGSGRIVGANVIGELAWSIENMLNRVLDETMSANAQIVAVTREGRAAVPALRDAFERRQPAADSSVAAIMDRADVLASGGRLEETSAAPGELASQLPEPEVVEATPQQESAEAARAVDDSETANLFEREAETHLAVLEARFVHAASVGTEAVSDEVVRALHTLRGSASMAGVESVARIAGPLYEVVREARDRGIEPGSDVVDFVQHGVFALRRELNAFTDGRASAEDASAFDKEAARIVAGFEQGAPVASSLLQLDGASVLLGAQEFVSSWHIGAMDLSALSDIVAALHELRNEAESQGQRALAALCDALIETYERLEDHPLSDAGYAALTQGHERLLEMFDAIAADTTLPGAAPEIAALNAVQVEEVPEEELSFGDSDEAAAPARVIEFPSFVRAPEQPERPAAPSKVADEEDVPLLEERAEPAPAPKPSTSRSEQAPPTRAAPPPPKARPRVPADTDPEILEIFFEEADELLESIEQCIQAWLGAPENRLHLETLLRSLHTLKGGARLAGLSELGDDAHGFESFLIGVQGKDSLPGGFFDALQARHDELVTAIGALKGGEPEEAGASSGAAPEVEQKQPEAVVPRPAPEPRPTPQPVEVPRKVAAKPAAEVEAPPEAVPEAAESDTAERQAASAAEPREQVRVAASLLEQLVNMAGESSIIRSRVEQGVSDFATSLEEMETTIERMREQLRRLEIETEAQVLFRQEAPQSKDYEEFDPLEMDRYSQLQQLSRSLSESASDMLVLKDALTNKARESETLLLQQARVNTELQEGLMRTRMVPFSRLLPRLRRTVRQVARDLGKEIDFHAYNAEGELDRNVLERMIPPLEHMLRNAVDHGIESVEARRGFGKPAKGRIDLRLSREAGDVVIEIGDDGAGIDVESVRAKAVERGLMTADARLRDEEILQFVLAPGFSTARSVTQISGRGVGMDVVHSAVKQLGGSITITSIPGKGTRFTVRLPFTVSVNRALMVTIGEDQYAVPLNTIEGIVRVSGAELARLYEPDGGGFEYAGVPYRVRYLGSFIGRDYVSLSDRASVPVVLVRSGDRAVAVHVDGVQGSREIVVKSLGPQFAGVAGISGATILGDGSVVVILDLVALIRAQTAPNVVNGNAAAAEERPTCVMVVDDSVTVRKVTSRLLERQGMDVMVAKDGVEAMALLQERRPDIMLLDIEMPRMDGFEVARQIRHDDRLSKLPIVMISSRTGAKHQERAVELGVDRFLGKPFQENELLATIEELVDLGD